MSKIKSSIAMLAAGGAMGVAGQASATTITYNYSGSGDSSGNPQNVNILGVTEYSYGPAIIKTDFSPVAAGALTGTYSQNPTSASTDTYSSNSIKTNSIAGPAFMGDSFLNLSFKVSGVSYLGTAEFTTGSGLSPDVVLDTITYAPATAAVPEPDAWLLLVGGMGLAGAALRRRRDQGVVAS